MSDVDAPETLKNLYPYPQRVIEVSSFLRDHGLSVFSTREAKSLGRPIEDSYRIFDSAACSGSIDQITSEPPNILPPNWAANGWAWSNLNHKIVDRVVLTSQSGIVIGFAAGGWPPSFLSDDLTRFPKGNIGWRGFLKATHNDPIIAYALLDSGSACRFGQGVLEKIYTGRWDELGLLRQVQVAPTSAWPVEIEDNHQILFAHAPSLISVDIPSEAHRLHIAFGFRSPAWQNGDPQPAQFSIRTQDARGNSTELWRRELNPKIQENDRGRQVISIEMPADFTGKIILSITPVASPNYLWTYWSAMSFD